MRTFFSTSLFFFQFPTSPLFRLPFLIFGGALSEDFLPAGLLLGLQEILRFSSSSLELLFSLPGYLFPPRLIIGTHSSQTFLRVKVVEMFLLGRCNRYLHILFMGDAILLLLSFIILCKEGGFFLPIRALEMINSLVENTKTFTEIAFLLIELFNLQADKFVRIILLDILFKIVYGQAKRRIFDKRERTSSFIFNPPFAMRVLARVFASSL